jgi:predicted RNase H-like HicB family nuclease
MRQVVLYPGEDGYWVAECPSSPGCVTQGRTREDALANAKEAVQGYVAALVEDHLPVPEDRLRVRPDLFYPTAASRIRTARRRGGRAPGS